MHLLFSFSLADFKTIQVPMPAPDGIAADAPLSILAGVALIIVAFAAVLFLLRVLLGRKALPDALDVPQNWILVDGSNVMHWQDNTPQIAPLMAVIKDLKARGFAPGVVFDANAGWKLFGKYMNERDLGRILGLPVSQVLVVPKGTQADPYILATARNFKAKIVTNDRYRDWAATYPEIGSPDFLIWGGMKEGKLWLRTPDLAPAIAPDRAVAKVS